MLEDIGLMRMLPGMVVIAPSDAEEARKAVVAAAKAATPIYIRFGRSPTPAFTTPETPFEIGKALLLWDSGKGDSPKQPKVSIMTTGSMAYQALATARALDAEGIGSLVLSVPTIKPLDEDAILEAAKRTGHVVTIEEHNVLGGFGSAVAEFLSQKYPVPVTRLGTQDVFGQSGTPEELLEHYGLSAAHITDVVRKIVR
jgi:transketolase